ncbi:MAG: FHA domain-containing protein [Actinomycetia bacterium]|nr:FHA domain-containing protein [Actinomycetes bacterium]
MTAVAGRLEVAAGQGLLCRRGRSLLYTPEASERAEPLIAAFKDPAQSDPGEAVAGAMVTAEFGLADFVVVDWRQRVHIMVFGDLALATDHPALPLLTGAGSSTWVEHSLRGAQGEVTIEVDAAEAATDSDLRDGEVPAGGFRLGLIVDVESSMGPADTIPAQLQARVTAPSPAPPAPSTGLASEPDAPLLPDPVPPPTFTAGIETLPAPDAVPGVATVPAASSQTPVEEPDDEWAKLLAGPEAAGTFADNTPPLDQTPTPSLIPPSDLALADDGTETQFDDRYPPRGDSDGDDSPDLIATAYCQAGHANGPDIVLCRLCSAPIVGDAVPVHHPELGVLILSDGQRVPLTKTTVFGRNPSVTDPGSEQVIQLDGEKVSRNHGAIVVDGWSVLVEDLGSRNGTRIVIDGYAPSLVEPGHRVPIEIGTTVFFGAEAVRYEAG